MSWDPIFVNPGCSRTPFLKGPAPTLHHSTTELCPSYKRMGNTVRQSEKLSEYPQRSNTGMFYPCVYKHTLFVSQEMALSVFLLKGPFQHMTGKLETIKRYSMLGSRTGQ